MSKSLILAVLIAASASGRALAFQNLFEAPVVTYIEDGRAYTLDDVEMRAASPKELNARIKEISATKCALTEPRRGLWLRGAKKEIQSMIDGLDRSLLPIPQDEGEPLEMTIQKITTVILRNQVVNGKITQLSALRKDLETACLARVE